MAIEITIPRLGWSMDEGTFGEWLKADGDFVEAGEAIFALENEKALQEVESVDSGILRILPEGPREGDTVTVGTLIGYLLVEGEALPEQPIAQSQNQTVHEVTPAPSVSATTRSTTSTRIATPAISPRAKRLAGELGIDWTVLTGSGSTGRIRERDVRAASERQPKANVPTTRRVIAERMLASVRNTAPVTLTTRVDATHLVDLREQYKASGTSPAPAYHDIIAKLLAATLKQHPVMNSQWTDKGIIQPEGIHLGVAVDTEAGLLVPVIRNVDRLSLLELASQSRDLIARARQRMCTPDELRGGTFSMTNLGTYGIDAFTPILNSPETAVLGLGTIRREAVVLDEDRIVPRHQLTLSLTFDHRVTDGAPAAAFLQELGRKIENPGPWLIR